MLSTNECRSVSWDVATCAIVILFSFVKQSVRSIQCSSGNSNATAVDVRSRLRCATEFRELEDGVPVPRRVRYADPLVEFLPHLAWPEPMRRVEVGDAFDDLDVLACHREGADALDILRARRAREQHG